MAIDLHVFQKLIDLANLDMVGKEPNADSWKFLIFDNRVKKSSSYYQKKCWRLYIASHPLRQ